ncbi:hypothetical protein LCGC14_2154660, partial [marine sediment metagenome]
ALERRQRLVPDGLTVHPIGQAEGLLVVQEANVH